MTEREFAFWLQGFFELLGKDPDGLTRDQAKMIKDHLALVFKQVTCVPEEPVDLGKLLTGMPKTWPGGSSWHSPTVLC